MHYNITIFLLPFLYLRIIKQQVRHLSGFAVCLLVVWE